MPIKQEFLSLEKNYFCKFTPFIGIFVVLDHSTANKQDVNFLGCFKILLLFKKAISLLESQCDAIITKLRTMEQTLFSQFGFKVHLLSCPLEGIFLSKIIFSV